MPRPPQISVIMTVFNNRRSVRQAVESVLAQTHRDFEFIIIDDGSTDGCSSILEALARLDPRIRLIRQPNRGIAHAANRAVAECSAEYIANIDHDDIARADRLEQHLRFMRTHDVVCAGADIELIDGRGRLLTTFRMPESDTKIQDNHLRGHTSIAHTSMIVRADTLRDAGAYDPAFDCAADLDLFLRLGERGALANIPIPLQRYRLHNASASEQQGARQLEQMRCACERAWRRRGVEGRYEFEGRPWRPDSAPHAQHPYHLRHGWWALHSGRPGTALLYGAKAILDRPLEPEGWKLLANAAARRAARQEWRKSA